MDIYARLISDHHAHRQLAEALQRATAPDDRATLLKRLRADVEAHANAEEQTFYAALLTAPEAQKTARHSIIEHEEIEDLFDAVEAAGPEGDAWPEAVKALVDRLKHHMREEEEDVFPEARAVLSEPAAVSMVQSFEARKDGDKGPPTETAFLDSDGARYSAPSV